MVNETPHSERKRPPEFAALFDVVQTIPWDSLTACQGWTVHEVVAHLVAGAEAIADQAEAFLVGKPIPSFGSWEERDALARAVDSAQLHIQLDASEYRMTRALDAISAVDPLTVIPEGGWGQTVTQLALHMRQEYAIHRWDFIGDDALGDQLLAQPEFLEHSVNDLGGWLLSRGLENESSSSSETCPESSGDRPFRAWVRSEGGPDVMIEIADGKGEMTFSPYAGDEGFVRAGPAARLLMLWGRHPQGAGRIRSTLPVKSMVRLKAMLQGF